MAGATMGMFTIDTLQFSERLIKEGMKPELAKVLVEEFKEAHEKSLNNLATKQDLKDIELALGSKMTEGFATIRKEISDAMLKGVVTTAGLVTLLITIVNLATKATGQ